MMNSQAVVAEVGNRNIETQLRLDHRECASHLIDDLCAGRSKITRAINH
jgi:hypothetical protein